MTSDNKTKAFSLLCTVTVSKVALFFKAHQQMGVKRAVCAAFVHTTERELHYPYH